MKVIGQCGQKLIVSWAKDMKGGAHSRLLAALFFPDSKRHPSRDISSRLLNGPGPAILCKIIEHL